MQPTVKGQQLAMYLQVCCVSNSFASHFVCVSRRQVLLLAAWVLLHDLQAEKVAGKFVAKRIRPALQRAREKELGEVLSESGEYLKGLWARLNGGGSSSKRALPPALLQPPGSKKEIEKVS